MAEQASERIARPLRTRAITENGQPVITVERVRDGYGRYEVDGEPIVPIIVPLSNGHQVERRTRNGSLQRSLTVGAITMADPAERAIFIVQGEADVLKLLLPLKLLEEVAGVPVVSVRALFNEHQPAIDRCALRALVALMRNDSSSELMLTSIAYELAGILIQDDTRQAEHWRGGISRWALQRIRNLVQARLDEPVPASPLLSELAQEAGISKHHFIKAFRETVGETPYAWVLRQRIERARTMLTHPEETVSDVAFHTGFSSPAHFTAVFRQHLGVTPGVFRKAVLG